MISKNNNPIQKFDCYIMRQTKTANSVELSNSMIHIVIVDFELSTKNIRLVNQT